MKQPSIEMADIIRSAGKSFIEKNRSWFGWQHLRVLRAIARCRTAALGGHRDECERCGHQAISYNSCRNRHCPKCQTNARDKWLAARQQELLPDDYYRLVFSVPMRWFRSSGRTRKFSSSSCSTPAPKHCWTSPPIRNTSARRSAFSASYTLGIRSSNRTLTHNACHYHLIDSQRAMPVVFPCDPLAEQVFPSYGAALECFGQVLHKDQRDESAKAPAEQLVRASTNLLPPIAPENDD